MEKDPTIFSHASMAKLLSLIKAARCLHQNHPHLFFLCLAVYHKFSIAPQHPPSMRGESPITKAGSTTGTGKIANCLKLVTPIKQAK